MKSSLKVLLIASIFIVAVVIFYYYVFILPANQNRDFLISMQEKCLKICQENYKNHDWSEKDNVWTRGSPTYLYNKKFNTCIIYDSLSAKDISFKSIRNCYTNEEMVLYDEYKGLPILPQSIKTEEEFWSKYRELFNEK